MNATVFAGMPLVESPLFDADDPALPFTEAEREAARSLARDGFAVIDFPDPDFDARAERIRANLSSRYGVDLDDPDSIKNAGERRIQDAWTFDDDVRAIAANPQVLDLLSKLWNRRAFAFQTLNFPVGTEQALHSDAVHFSSVPERFMAGVWVAMEDIDETAGPVEYVAGSHRWPIMNNTVLGRRGWKQELASAQDPFGPAWAALLRVHGAQAARFLPRKGQALIWCANLLNGGTAQTDPRRTRWSQVTHYYFDDCIYYTPAFSDEPLGRLQLRKLVDVADGARKPNLYLGEEIVAIPDPVHFHVIPKRPLHKRVGRMLQRWRGAPQ